MPSAVAGVLDHKGGLRVVVTERWRMRHHVGKRERLFVVPGLEVQEPVPWHSIPWLIATVQRHVTKELAPTNNCGECTACCKTLYIRDGDFAKPSGMQCTNCSAGFGCKLYHNRPSVCRAFECRWLKSQGRNDRMAPELRPDRCNAIFTEDSQTNDPLLIECHGKPNADAWRWIHEMQVSGWRVKEVTHYVGEAK